MRRREALKALAASFGTLAPIASSQSGCATRAPDGRIEATFWHSFGGAARKALLSLLDRFHAEQPRYAIKASFQGDYNESVAKLRTAYAAGAQPALTHVVLEIIPYLAEAGVLEPFTRFGAIDDLDLVPELAQAKTFEGGDARPIVALPFGRSTPLAYVNPKAFEAKKLAPPATWDDLRAAARALTTSDRAGFMCPVDWWFWIALVGQAGGRVIAPDGAIELGGEAGVRALELWQRMVYEDRSMAVPPGRDYDSWGYAKEQFTKGAIPMIWSSAAFLVEMQRDAKDGVVAAMLPGDVRRSVPTGGTMFVLPKGAPAAAQEAAFAFVHWMLLPRQSEEWSRATGYIPVSRGAIHSMNEGYFKESPNAKVPVEQLAHAQPWAWTPRLFRVEREVMMPRIEAAVYERGDARATLDGARKALERP